ncbi:hypothetical protein BS78_02G376400 [Paspalum vaginatum]|nr:hypothetical protein BS78_02G376400 [Paspalum vaginatum]
MQQGVVEFSTIPTERVSAESEDEMMEGGRSVATSKKRHAALPWTVQLKLCFLVTFGMFGDETQRQALPPLILHRRQEGPHQGRERRPVRRRHRRPLVPRVLAIVAAAGRPAAAPRGGLLPRCGLRDALPSLDLVRRHVPPVLPRARRRRAVRQLPSRPRAPLPPPCPRPSSHSRIRLAGIILVQPYFGGEERMRSELELEGKAWVVNIKGSDWAWKAKRK